MIAKPGTNWLASDSFTAENVYQPGVVSSVATPDTLGREGIYEIMPLTNDLLSYISAESDIQQIRDAAISQGMKTLRMAGAEKVAAGITSMEEVLRVTPELGRAANII